MYFLYKMGFFTMASIKVKIRQKWLIAPHLKALYKVYTLHSLHSPFGVSGDLWGAASKKRREFPDGGSVFKLCTGLSTHV